MKLITPLGEIRIEIDDKLVDYDYKCMKSDARFEKLGGRYFIYVPIEIDGKAHTISCRISGYIPSDKDMLEPGENLELKSFYSSETKLSIGMKGDMGLQSGIDTLFDYDNNYLDDGVQYVILPTTKTSEYVFAIAWLDNYRCHDETLTWFGADPTY